MRLFFNKTSPYARKARVAVHELGLLDEVAFVEVDPWGEPPELLVVTPLSKVPALVTESGQLVTESDTIAAVLDASVPDRHLLPKEASARQETLARAALCQGLIDASFISVIEGRRPDGQRWDAWVARQQRAVARTVAVIDAKFDLDPNRFDLGDIGLACGLAYVDFRLPGFAWRQEHPRLAAWLDRAVARPSMQATQP